jgi:hypothetical protein
MTHTVSVASVASVASVEWESTVMDTAEDLRVITQ